VSKRVIVVDDLDTHFRTISEIRNVETFAFSCSDLALAAARVLLPDLFVIAERERAVDVDRLAAEMCAHAELCDVPVLILAPGCDATEGVAVTPTIRRIDPANLGAHLKRLLEAEYAPVLLTHPAEESRRAERYARHCDSLSRIALMRTVDDDRFIAAVLREGAESLRDDVAFSATLLRLEGADWVVEAAYEPPKALVSLPEAGSRMPLHSTVAAVLRAGTTLVVREAALSSGADSAWRAVVAAPVSSGTAVRILFLAAAREPRDSFDDHDRAFVDTLVSLCASRLRQREQLACLRFNAEHDALTGILNRAAFRVRGVAALRAAGASGARTAVAVLDLDRFHEVNDALGHQKGDSLIVEVAAALAERAGDDVVARLGGDAFGILMYDVADRADVERRIARYSARFDEPFGTGDRDGSEHVHLSASIGIACAPDDAGCLEDLLSRADAAMFAAKEESRGGWSFFEPAVEANFIHALTLQNELAEADLDEDFVLHFQPQVDLTTGTIAAAEALVRWKHPERGLLMPAEFIPFAEEHGLLRSVETWVARGAAAAAVRLNELVPSFRIWFSISSAELARPGLLRALTELGSARESLGVEIRQSAAMHDLQRTRPAFAALKQLGFAIALDDFGTGQWPLSELMHLPIDLVKLDRSFTAGLPGEERDRDIVTALLIVGKRFGFETLAKGIETSQQARALREAGCTYGQGYLLGHPMPFDELASLLAARPHPIKRRTRRLHSVAV
jgi:diguanylate cyclase (GGDEF)-like protein